MYLLAFLLILCAPLSAQEQRPRVLVLEAKGAVTPPLSAYLREGIEEAQERRVSALLMEIDTPGGLLDSTREIVQAMLNTPGENSEGDQ